MFRGNTLQIVGAGLKKCIGENYMTRTVLTKIKLYFQKKIQQYEEQIEQLERAAGEKADDNTGCRPQIGKNSVKIIR